MSSEPHQLTDVQRAMLPGWAKFLEVANSRPVAPDAKQAIAFFAALFPASAGQSVHFRSVPEPKRPGEHPRNLHYALDGNFENNLRGFLDYCAATKQAAFFLPGTVRGNGTGKKDVLSLPAIVVDFDKGKPDESLTAAEGLLGSASLVIESGGMVDNTYPKLHAYWALRTPAVGDADVGLACRVREALAVRFGGDPAFKQAAQVIRVPGSIHFKSQPKGVTIRTVRPEAVYSLAELVSAVGDIAPKSTSADNPFDFTGDAAPRNDVERVLTAPVHEGGVDDITRFEAAGKAIGHFIRCVRTGLMTPEEAWSAAKDWNVATLVPPWSEERLRNDFERLVRNDVEARGPFIPVERAVATGASGGRLTDWNIKKLVGAPPERRWLVEGLIPASTAGVFAAVGGAGKSMMALRLAYIVGCYPEPKRNADFAFDVPRFFGQPVVARGSAVVLTAEDDAAEVHRRIAALDSSNLRAGNPKVYVRPMLSDGGPRAVIADGPAGVQPTEFWREIREQLLEIPDLKLVVLDPLSHFAAIKLDNDNQAGAALMSMLGAFAAESGAAVMLVHHMGKAVVPTSLSDARTAIRGAGALVDNGRWALAMWEADEDKAYSTLKTLGQEERARSAGVVYLGGLAKGNAPSDKVLRTLARNPSTGLLEDVTDQLAAARPRQAEVDEAALVALRAEATANARFMFGRGEQSLWKAWEPILDAAGIHVPRPAFKGLFARLESRGELVRTDTVKGGHSLFAVRLDD